MSRLRDDSERDSELRLTCFVPFSLHQTPDSDAVGSQFCVKISLSVSLIYTGIKRDIYRFYVWCPGQNKRIAPLSVDVVKGD
jgi:hypothetical protein